jgi:DNA mismatch endonuclease (patch repair protein)
MPLKDIPIVVRMRMRQIRKKDTMPERKVRRLIHAMGYRYRLHRRGLPGTPDLVFPSKKKAIFVHGCFWHQHLCPLGNKRPKVNQGYWLPKLERNRNRDVAVRQALGALGWNILVVWECELSDEAAVANRIRVFLESRE